MLGSLTQEEAEQLLKDQVTARLACSADDELYIVPVNYVMKDHSLFAHSAEGKKIRMMRKNPKVCVEVDEIRSIFNWKSVIGWGTFTEITDPSEKQQAMQLIIHRIMPFNDHPDGHPSHGITSLDSDVGDIVELILYKIDIDQLTGRYEYHPVSP